MKQEGLHAGPARRADRTVRGRGRAGARIHESRRRRAAAGSRRTRRGVVHDQLTTGRTFGAFVSPPGHAPSGISGLSLSLGLTPYSGDPNECGAATDVEVNVGDQVNVCYTLTNNSGQTLQYQSIVDSVDGAIVTFDPTPIAPGASHNYVRTIVATTDTSRSAAWTGYANISAYAYDSAATPGFIDISTTGTNLGFVVGDNLDDEFVEVTPGFPIRFYGQTSTALCISNDGFIGYNDAACTSPGAGQDPDPGFSFRSTRSCRPPPA